MWHQTLTRANHKNEKGKTPYEVITGRKPDLLHLRVFGTKVKVVKTHKYRKSTVEPKVCTCAHGGYAQTWRKEDCIMTMGVCTPALPLSLFSLPLNDLKQSELQHYFIGESCFAHLKAERMYLIKHWLRKLKRICTKLHFQIFRGLLLFSLHKQESSLLKYIRSNTYGTNLRTFNSELMSKVSYSALNWWLRIARLNNQFDSILLAQQNIDTVLGWIRLKLAISWDSIVLQLYRLDVAFLRTCRCWEKRERSSLIALWILRYTTDTQ